MRIRRKGEENNLEKENICRGEEKQRRKRRKIFGEGKYIYFADEKEKDDLF